MLIIIKCLISNKQVDPLPKICFIAMFCVIYFILEPKFLDKWGGKQIEGTHVIPHTHLPVTDTCASPH